MRPQLARKDVRIASGGYDLTAVLGMKTAQCAFVILHILHLVDKKIILAAFGQSGYRVVIQLFGRHDIAERLKLLVNIYYISIRAIPLKPVKE